MKRKFVYLFISLFVYLYIPRPADASGEFTADYDVVYEIAPTGTTVVTQRVSLTNKLTNLYARQYSILFDTTGIKNVVAYDDGGSISPTITQKDGKTEILLPFNTQAVGVGKKSGFTLRFENNEIAKKLGNVWEINIPGVAADPDLGQYAVSVAVPSSFGPVAYMSPPPGTGGKWNKDQMTHGGISIAYGKEQSFALNLSYFLENSELASKKYEIALPPDTAYQTIVIDSIDPQPSAVYRDSDGNWLARYDLSPRQKLSINARLTASLYITPSPLWHDQLPDPSRYLAPTRYWQTADPAILTLAAKYRTPRAIYDAVVSILSYDYNRVNQNPIRRGAKGALEAPNSALCTEFTDLFVALARAAGIPARESVGFAYTTNTKLRPLSLVKDILHAWPQYYDSDKNLWIPVDPTWADTTGGVDYFDKLDFNHITFAIHGIQSDYPYPAGFYREPGKTTRDVAVSFYQGAVSRESPKLLVSYQFPKTVIAGVLTKGTVDIHNVSGKSASNIQISVQSSPVDVALYRVEALVPPLSTVTIPLSITIPNYFYRGDGRIVTTLGETVATYLFTIRPTYWFLFPVFAVMTVICAVFFLFLWKPHRKKI